MDLGVDIWFSAKCSILFQDAEGSQSTIDILSAPLSVCLAEELGEGCEKESDDEEKEETSTALIHCLFR